MSINDILIDDCLISILENFSLQELIKLRSVCLPWKFLIETKIFFKKHSLKLFGSTYSIKEYCSQIVSFDNEEVAQHFRLHPSGLDDDIIVQNKWFNEKFCCSLAKLFPNIKRLVIWFDRKSHFKELPTLLKLFPTLVRLSLLGYIIYDPIKDFFLLQVCKAINCMAASLNHLDLLPVNLFRTEQEIQVLLNNMPDILPNLSNFSLRLFGYRGNIEPLLRELGPSCCKFRLESLQFFDSVDLAQMIDANSFLQNKLTHLRLTGIERNLINFICQHLKTLRFLSLGFSGLPNIENVVIENLNELENLCELRLENVLLEMNLPIDAMVPITQVKKVSLLGLDLGRWSFDDVRFLKIIGYVFPALEEITIRCVNSIDDREMFGSFEFAPQIMSKLQAKNAFLERDLCNQLAGRHAEQTA